MIPAITEVGTEYFGSTGEGEIIGPEGVCEDRPEQGTGESVITNEEFTGWTEARGHQVNEHSTDSH